MFLQVLFRFVAFAMEKPAKMGYNIDNKSGFEETFIDLGSLGVIID